MSVTQPVCPHCGYDFPVAWRTGPNKQGNAYATAWLSLKLRRALFFIGLVTPFFALYIYRGLNGGSLRNHFGALILLSLSEWMAIGLAPTVIGTVSLYLFDCPRCHSRFVNAVPVNIKCGICGVEIDASPDSP